jgi:hypothetical protein
MARRTKEHRNTGATSTRASGGMTTMPQDAWSDKRDRQYEHIKEGLLERRDSEPLAEESAGRSKMTKVQLERALGGR